MKKIGLLRKIGSSFKWVYATMPSFTARILVYTVFTLVNKLLFLYITYRTGSFVDYIVTDDMSRLLRASFLFVCILVSNVAIAFGLSRLNAWNYNAMQKDFFMKVYNKILKSDWESLTLHHSGDLMSRIGADVKTVTGNANGLIPTIASQTLMIVGAVAIIVYYDFSILLVFMVMAPLVLLSTRVFMNKEFKCHQKIRETEADIMSFNKETFHNMQAVKAFGLADVFYAKMDKKEQALVQIDMKSNLYAMLSWVLSCMSGLVAVIICAAWAISRLRADIITIGNLTSMAALAVQAALNASGFLKLIPTILEFTTSTTRIRELMEIPDEQGMEVTEKEKKIIHKGTKEGLSIQIDDMSFCYHVGGNIFEEVSLHADAGEIVALVGPSGEGKTTMLRIILGIVSAQKGRSIIKLDSGESVRLGYPTRELIAYVPQGNTMMAGTIADNMRMISENATDEQIIEALRTACAYDFVEKLPDGIYHEIGESGLGFSEGQNQRLAIARAILRNTPILLLDEATSALDVVTERRVLSNLLKKDDKKICIVTTHRPSVLSLCNRVYRISNKKVRPIGEEEITKLMNEF
ncbi:MAG: ABC transporter ATP-binding protein [Lachnospiraceae bacterium]|nr:ABC transporter ATP-binding protein [Lachnospiraceae bacterium]